MSEKPTTASGQNHRKRKLEDMPSANGEYGHPKSQKKIIDGEKKKSLRQIKGWHVDDKVEDVERASSMKISTRNQESQGQTQLVRHTSCEVDTIYPTILPSFNKSSATQTNRNLSTKNSLCRRCAKIDLDMLLSRSHKTHAGQPAKDLSPVSSWETSSCTLCSLFQSTLHPIWSTQDGRKVPLRTYSSNKMVDKVWSSISTNLLQVGYGGRYIVSQPEGIEGPVKIKDEIGSFDCVKDWISLCLSWHRICDLEVRASGACRKLIDCETRTIVPGEDRPYVALSYVWGRPSSDISNDPNRLPANLPNTIQDAMTVTKRLGYRYLWVDRYCIDQENEQEKADEVEKMDLIYIRRSLPSLPLSERIQITVFLALAYGKGSRNI